MPLGSGWRVVLPSTAILLAACGQDGVPRPEPFPPSSTSSTSSSGGADGEGGQGGSAQGGGGSGGAGGQGGATTTAASSSSAAGATTGAGGQGGSGACTSGEGAPPVLVHQGDTDKLLLRGLVVTPDQTFAGEVLVLGDTIACVASACTDAPGAATASIVETHGLIFPGLIDTHNHILFDIFNEDDWAPTQSYTNHNQWTSSPRYGALVDTKQYLNGESGSPLDLGCELDKYGELKGLIAGTTSIQGSATPGNKACYGSLSRTIDQTPNGLMSDKIQTATLFPSTSSADAVCTNLTSGKTDAYVIHIAEGIDAVAKKEFATLTTISTTDGCLFSPKTTIIHGAALDEIELTQMAASGMSLVWSPQSNVFLYGAGTELTATTNIPLARSKGINIALAPDWSLGGSQNILDELRFADRVDNNAWGNTITPQELVKMVTIQAAKALGLDAVLGSITVGKKADQMIIGGDTTKPYDALLAATPAEVRLVLVGGVVLYGDKELQPLGQASPACDDLDVCCRPKFACVAAPGGTEANKLGQTLGEIQSTLSTALSTYDAQCCFKGTCYAATCCDEIMNGDETLLDCGGSCAPCPLDSGFKSSQQWTFSPLAPLVKCQ